jgi:hypothetical protein
MADTAALVVALSAQLTQFEKDMGKANEIAATNVKKIESTFNNANIRVGGLEALGSRLTQLLTIGGIVGLVEQIAKLNEEVAHIGDGAEKLGITTNALQTLHFAAVETGSSVEKMDTFLDTFSRKMAEAATGTGALYNFLRVNNIAANEFVKLPLVEQLTRYSQLVINTKNPQEQLGETFLVGGRNAADMLAVLKDLGTQGFDTLSDKAKAAGTVIDESLIERAKRANAEWQVLQLRMKTFFEEAAVNAIQSQKGFLANAESLGAEWSKTLIDYYQKFVDFVKTKNPEVAASISEMLRSAREQIADLDRENAARGPRRGAEIIDASKYPALDNRFRPVQEATGADTTKQFNQQAEDLNKLIQAQVKRNELLSKEAELVGESAGAQAQARVQIQLENEAKEKHITLSEADNARIRETAAAAGAAAQAVYQANQAWQGLNSAVQFAGNQMIDIMVGLTNKTLTAQQAMKQLTDALVKALLQAALLGQGPLGNILGFGATSPGGTGGLGGILATGLKGLLPARAGGGPVYAGNAYVVGEQGKELFVPGASGAIVPNQAQMARVGGTTTVEINNYMSTQADTQQRSQSGPSGDRIIVDIVKKAQSRGDFDDVNRGRYGLRPNKVR